MAKQSKVTDEGYAIPGTDIRYNPDKCGEAFQRLDEAIREFYKLKIPSEDRPMATTLMQKAVCAARDATQAVNRPVIEDKKLEAVFSKPNLLRADMIKVRNLQSFIDPVDLTSDHGFKR